MKTRHALMALALAGAAGLVFFGDKTPGSDVAEPVQRSAAVAARVAPSARSAADAGSAVRIVALRPRAELVGQDGEPGFADNAVLFQGQSWNAPPPAPSATALATQAARAAQAANAAPAQAPALPFTYIGKAVGDGIWEVFLARAEKTYIVREKTVIDGQYRVERIAPPTATLTYLPLQQVQQINIGALD